MPARLIAEVGSTHMGRLDYAKEAVERCVEAGFDAIKFQLFPNDPKFTSVGNVWLDPEKYLEIAEHAGACGIDCSASVFDDDSFDFIVRTAPKFMKFAYSNKHRNSWIRECIQNDIEAIVSCDIMSDREIDGRATKLFCIPQYPVYFKVEWYGIFPRFDGFSDHTLGYDQTIEAFHAGAKVIEKHITLTRPGITCPDSFFALTPTEFKFMVNAIRRYER